MILACALAFVAAVLIGLSLLGAIHAARGRLA